MRLGSLSAKIELGFAGGRKLCLGGNNPQILKDWSYLTVGVRGCLAQGDLDSSKVVLACRNSGEQELLDVVEPYTHS
jgi:hypothetical protein